MNKEKSGCTGCLGVIAYFWLLISFALVQDDSFDDAVAKCKEKSRWGFAYDLELIPEAVADYPEEFPTYSPPYIEIRKVSTKEVKWQGEKYIEVTVKAQANNETAERSCLIKKERRGLLLLPGYYLIR